MIFTIGEAARQIGVAASTLRYYDKEGLLPFVERSNAGIRMFKDEDLSWLKTIECLKKTGMPIKDIKKFIDYCIEGDSRIDERLSIIKSQRDSVIEQIKELQKMLDILNLKCWYYETAKEAGTCEIYNSDNIQLEKIPKEYHEIITNIINNKHHP